MSSTMTRKPENIMQMVSMGVAKEVAMWKEDELAEMKRPMETETSATIKFVDKTIGNFSAASIEASCERKM